MTTTMKVNNHAQSDSSSSTSSSTSSSSPVSLADLLKNQLGAVALGIGLATSFGGSSSSVRVGAVPLSDAPDLKPIKLQKEGKNYKFGDVLGKRARLLSTWYVCS